MPRGFLSRLRTLIEEGERLSDAAELYLGKDRFLRFRNEFIAAEHAFREKLPGYSVAKGLRWTVSVSDEGESSANAFRAENQDGYLTDFCYEDYARATEWLRALEMRYQSEVIPGDSEQLAAIGHPSPPPSISLRPECEPRFDAGLPDLKSCQELLTEKQVASYLTISPSTLRKWRMMRRGPRFTKLGKAVRYSPSAVIEYMEARSKQ
jgi:predicted DNA-binding transcriptional regulator AlpA